jgi:hypothetical protein
MTIIGHEFIEQATRYRKAEAKAKARIANKARSAARG